MPKNKQSQIVKMPYTYIHSIYTTEQNNGYMARRENI